MKKGEQPGLFTTQVFGQSPIGGIAKRLRQQSLHAGGEPARGHMQAMRRDLLLLMPVAKSQSIQQQLHDRLRKLRRRTRSCRDHVLTAPNQMAQTRLMKGVGAFAAAHFPFLPSPIADPPIRFLW